MPFAQVTLFGVSLSPARRDELARRVAEVMRDTLGTPYRLTAVIVDEVPAGSWTIGGQGVQRGAHVEATVSVGSKTDEQKAAFVSAMRGVLEQFATPLPEPTFIVVRELSPSAWGFGGSTIASRAG